MGMMGLEMLKELKLMMVDALDLMMVSQLDLLMLTELELKESAFVVAMAMALGVRSETGTDWTKVVPK